MLQLSRLLLKKGWTHSPGKTRRGGKNLAWRPKLSERKLEGFVPLGMTYPPRRLASWNEREFTRLGLTSWPKEVAFYNAGDNFEIAPEMMYRLFKKNCDEEMWTPQHNEKTIVHLMPLVEQAPKEYVPKVDEIFRHHVKRFGVDHVIYHAVMQSLAFAKEYDRCLSLYSEMSKIGLAPNAQTIVNLMLAAKLSGKPKEKAEEFFTEGIRTGALDAIMRLDVEFQMWWDQLERMGSFTAPQGFLSVKEEGAVPIPRDMFALWGWDNNERKFVSRRDAIREQVQLQTRRGKNLFGTVFTKYRRQPWANYKGMLPWDVKGPRARQPVVDFSDAPSPSHSM